MGKRLLFLALGLAAAFTGHPEDKLSNAEHVRVSAVQIMGCDKTGNKEEGLDPVAVLLPYIERAGRDNADLLVFPEYHLGRIRVPGPETNRIADAVARENLYVIVGAWELLDGHKYANAALLFGRDGHILGKYHKTHAAVDQFDTTKTPWTCPPPGKDHQWFIENDPEWKMERGQRLPVFELDFGKIAILTCYDGWFSEPWRIVSLEGAELVVWLNGRGGRVEDFLIRSAMFWNEIDVVAVNQACGAGTTIAHYPDVIVERVEQPGEACISTTLNLNALRHARAHSRNRAQRRPDLYGGLTEESRLPEP